MKFQTYTSTPGLERFPKRERLAKWQAAHKHLLREDVRYRKRFHSYLTTMVCLSIPLMAVYGWYFGYGLTSFAANLAIIIGVTAAMIFLALRQMHYMNQCIGRYWQSHHDALTLDGALPPAY
jgi:hypothetical protein